MRAEVLFLISYANYICSLTFQLDKIKTPAKDTFRNLHSENLSTSQRIEGLYTINFTIGTHKQNISFIFDTGSSIFWVGSENCSNCLSKNLYNSSLSSTFKQTNNTKIINYSTGKVSGIICDDIITFNYNNNNLIQNFSFLLGDYVKIPKPIDGIAGFGKQFEKIEYSIISSMYNNKIINSKSFSTNFNEMKLYLGEIPHNVISLYKKVSCLSNFTEDNLFLWACSAEQIIIGDKIIKEKESVYVNFDSGTNGIVFPVEYYDIFKDNVFACVLNSEVCKYSNNQIQCNKNIKNLSNISIPNIFLVINSTNVSINVLKTFNEETLSFSLYFLSYPIYKYVFGSPFFEQFPLNFDLNRKEITIFYHSDNRVNFLKSLIVLIPGFGVIVFAIVIYCIVKTIRNKMKKNLPNSVYLKIADITSLELSEGNNQNL